jgi:hypothetical protein
MLSDDVVLSDNIMLSADNILSTDNLFPLVPYNITYIWEATSILWYYLAIMTTDRYRATEIETKNQCWLGVNSYFL